MAVRLEQIDGNYRVLHAEVHGSIKHMLSAMDSVQIEVRRAAEKMSDVSALQQRSEQDREALERIERQVVSLGQKVETQLDRMNTDNEERWARHEAENEDAERDVQNKLTDMDRKMVRALGWVGGFSATAALLLGVVVYTINLRFDNASRDASKVDPLIEKVHQIELYLARDGRPPKKENP